MALLEKRKEERQEKRKNLEDLAFNEWKEKTPDKEIKKLVPSGGWTFLGDMHLQVVKEHFIKNEMEGFLEGLP